MKRTKIARSRVSSAKASSSSSLAPRITTQLSLSGASPAASAASIPARTRSRPGRRASARNRSSRSVSSETFTRRKPAATSGSIISSSSSALVESEMSSMPGDRVEPRDEFGQVAPHERFAARQPDAAHADRGAGRDDPLDLFVREDLGLGNPRQPGLGHAVDATQITTVGHRDPQVGDRAVEGVRQGGDRRRRSADQIDRLESHRDRIPRGSPTSRRRPSRRRAR